MKRIIQFCACELQVDRLIFFFLADALPSIKRALAVSTCVQRTGQTFTTSSIKYILYSLKYQRARQLVLKSNLILGNRNSAIIWRKKPSPPDARQQQHLTDKLPGNKNNPITTFLRTTAATTKNTLTTTRARYNKCKRIKSLSLAPARDVISFVRLVVAKPITR